MYKKFNNNYNHLFSKQMTIPCKNFYFNFYNNNNNRNTNYLIKTSSTYLNYKILHNLFKYRHCHYVRHYLTFIILFNFLTFHNNLISK